MCIDGGPYRRICGPCNPPGRHTQCHLVSRWLAHSSLTISCLFLYKEFMVLITCTKDDTRREGYYADQARV
jgi:hypothetical protein